MTRHILDATNVKLMSSCDCISSEIFINPSQCQLTRVNDISTALEWRCRTGNPRGRAKLRWFHMTQHRAPAKTRIKRVYRPMHNGNAVSIFCLFKGIRIWQPTAGVNLQNELPVSLLWRRVSFTCGYSSGSSAIIGD